MVRPIGVIQNVNLSHNRTFNRIFDIARILYHGPSLLRMVYSYYEDAIPPTIVEAVFPNAGIATVANPHDVIIPPGYENFFVNLASDLFNQPIGLLLYVRDSNLDTYGAVYLEGCYVPNHTWATDAQGVIIQESAAIQFERAVPVAVSALTLISGAAGGALGIGG